MIFKGEASNVDCFLRSYYNPTVRKDWDMDLRSQIVQTQDESIQVIEEIAKNSVVSGYNLTKCVYKRLYWRDMGCFYTYESSVPDDSTAGENMP